MSCLTCNSGTNCPACLFPPCAVIVFAAGILLSECLRKNSPHRWVLFPLHVLSCVLMILLLLSNTMHLAEHLLSSHLTQEILPSVAAVLDLLGTLAAWYVYNAAENLNQPKYLFILFLYWMSTVSMETWLLIEDLSHGINTSHMRLYIRAATIAWRAGLTLVNIYLFSHQAYCCCHDTNPRQATPRRELSQISYLHPYAGLLSKCNLHWLTPLFRHGFKNKTLTLNDLGRIPKSEYTKDNFDNLQSAYSEEEQRTSVAPSLWRVIWRVHWRMILVSGFLKLLSNQLLFIPPLCLDLMVNYVSLTNDQVSQFNSTTPYMSTGAFISNGYIIALAAFVSSIFHTALIQNHCFLNMRTGIRCRSSIQALVFHKSLRISASDALSPGQLMNLMSVDAQHMFDIFVCGHQVWCIPLQVFVGFIILYLELGSSALLAGTLLLLVVPIQFKVGRKLGLIQKKAMEESDLRMKYTNEAFQNIKYIKLSASESSFKQNILKVRVRELKLLLIAAVYRIFSISVTDGLPVIGSVLAFCLYQVFESEPMNAGKVFAVLALFNILTIPLFNTTFVINTMSHAFVSAKRLQEFFAKSEIHKTTTTPASDVKVTPSVQFNKEISDLKEEESLLSPLVQDSTNGAKSPNNTLNPCNILEVHNASFTWNDETSLQLKDISIGIPRGKLTVIIGSVGSGKSSLLAALLGEMESIKGDVVWQRGISKAWVSQQTWLMNATLRDNILFTKKHDSSLYDEVIECCALKHDINALAAGDLTEIGENGLNLSGGQQQRVNIGRALYSNADVVLMDDPLSALDAHVRYQVFHHAIQEFLIRKHKRTVVAVMHDAQYTQHADWVIMMKEGRVSYEGTWNGAHHISALNRKNQVNPEGQKEKKSHTTLSQSALYEPKISEVCFASRSMSSIDSFIQSTEMLSENNEEEGLTEKGKLVQAEEQKTGSVSWRVYFSYSQSAGHVLVFLSIALYLTHQSLQMVADFWLSDWMEAEHATGSVHANSTLHSQTSSEIKLIMWGYVAFQLSAVLILFFSILMIEIMALRAAYNFHANMLSALLKAPLRFFDCTPLGRILNRFSSDTNIIDKLLVTNMDHVLYNTLHVIGGIIVNGISNSFFLLPLAPIFCAFVFIQRFYLTSCRELQRLNNITKSPILSNFSETLNGLPTIRAYGVQKWFLDKHFSLVDVNLTVFLYLKTAAIWLGIRFGYLGALIVFSACVCSISAGINGSISPSVVGLAIAYAIITTSLLIIMMRGISEMEMLFNSVERVSLYIATPPEKERGHNEIAEYWPTSGDIEFKDLCARYDQNLKPVLKNVNLTIKSGEKIGICGRTGSGKSSLTLCLFQMIEVHQGHLLIDGVDISTLPLGLLRKRIAIIPQDPVLFHGSIRHNLDPSSSRTDIELWSALHSAQLQGTIKAFPLGLDTIVAESGVNLSVGQRQLFCLARAILSNSRILILDEATSSVDMATDALIQKVIQSSFAQSTVISIAHRVRTLEHCNRIVVMSDGRIAEEGQPSELKNSAFARLMQ